jgi:hypothetical protein
MGAEVFIVGALLIAGTTVYSVNAQRKAANKQADAAREAAAAAAAQAEELAKLQALRDKTSSDESSAIGRLELGEDEAQRKKRSKGKAAFIIEEQKQKQSSTASRVQIGENTPDASSGGVQL